MPTYDPVQAASAQLKQLKTILTSAIDANMISVSANFPNAVMEQRELTAFPIPLTSLKVWDAFHTNLPGTPANDDLGLITGTFGTDSNSVQTSDLKNTTTTQYAGFEFVVPENYETGQTIELNISAGQLTTLASVSATLDVEAYKPDGIGGVGSDLCQTAAQSIKSLTMADKVFVLDGSGLYPGDRIEGRIAIAINDSATETAVDGIIGNIELLADCRG